MNPATPSLKTLIAWADQARAGSEPLDCACWRGQAAAVERARWDRVVEALEQIDHAAWPANEPTLAAEVVAAYIDDRLNVDEAAMVEQTCLASTADLWEVISELRFAYGPSHDEPDATDASSLVARLLQIHPAAPATFAASVEADNAVQAPPVAAAPVPPPVALPRAPVVHSPTPFVVHPIRVGASPATRRPKRSANWAYLAAGGIGAMAAITIVVIVILSSANRSTSSDRTAPNLAHDGAPSTEQHRDPPSVPAPPANLPPSTIPLPPDELVRNEPVERPRSPDAPRQPEPSTPVPGPTPPNAPQRPRASVNEIARPTQPNPSPRVPNNSPPPTPPSVPSAPIVLALRSEIGAALIPGTAPGAWRVGLGEQSLSEPLTIVSLADSWTTADVAGLGTLIFSGDAKATVSRDADRLVRVSVEHGHVGLRDLAENARVRIEAGGESWSAQGVGPYSTFAVVRDDNAAGVYVSSGIIAIDDTSIAAGQASLVQAGAPSIPHSIQARVSTSLSAFTADPYDINWLKTPDEKRKRDWQALYGKLADQLAAADDATTVLRQLREAARDGRQHVLLARWNLAIADDRAVALWEMLKDRQKSVRLAATQELLSIPPRDGRLRAFFPALREATDPSTAAMVLEWVGRSHRNNTLAPATARELVDGLGHQDPAVRQVAVFLLEHYSQDALNAARLRPPAFDARDTAAKRAIAQAQWRTLAAQLFANRNRGAAAGANKAMP